MKYAGGGGWGRAECDAPVKAEAKLARSRLLDRLYKNKKTTEKRRGGAAQATNAKRYELERRITSPPAFSARWSCNHCIGSVR